MKAILYHADTNLSTIFPEFEARKNVYQNLVRGLKDNLKVFDLELIHLTVKGHDHWGDITFEFDGDPDNIVYNREKFLLDFLKSTKDEEEFLVLEPDHRILKRVPSLPSNVCLGLLRRDDSVAITPSWKLVKKSSIPFFEEVLCNFDTKFKWDGDSIAYIKLFENMGSPPIVKDEYVIQYKGMKIQFRDYQAYSTQHSSIMRQWKGVNKLKLLD